MSEQASERNLDILHAGIAKSHEEIAGLVAGLKKLAERTTEKSAVEDGQPRGEPTNGEKMRGAWTGFRHSVNEAGARGERVAKGFADEIERHPLIGGVAAFGVGFVLARLLFRGARPIPKT